MPDAGAQMGGYRYSLSRDILCNHGPKQGLIRDCDRRKGMVLFVMLNPSTATDTEDDATIRRCMGFADSWRYSQLVVVNLFALRATRPRTLKLARNPIGRYNDDTIRLHAGLADLIVCAWGAHGKTYNRGAMVTRMLRQRGHDLYCLGLTKEGHPRHPLRLSGATEPTLYAAAFED